MAIIHTSGTQLDNRPQKSLANLMLYMVGLLLTASLFIPEHSLFNLNLTWVIAIACIIIGFYSSYLTRQFHFQKLDFVFLISASLITIPLLFPQTNIELGIYKILAIWLGGLLLLSLQQVQWTARQHAQLIGIICTSSLIYILYNYNLYYLNKNLHPEILSSLLSVTLVLSVYLITQNKQHPWLQFILAFTPILIIPMVFIINTFIGWIAIFCCILLIQPYIFHNLGLNRWLHWFCCLLIAFAIGLFLATSEPSFWDRLYEKIPRGSTQLLMQIKDMLLEQPIFGYGYAQFESAYNSYVAYQVYWEPEYPTAVVDALYPWNEWLYWWVEGGLFALAGLLMVLIFCLYQLTKVALAKRLLLVAIFLPQFIQATLSTPFYHTNFHWFLLIILIYWFNQQTKSK